MTEEKFNQIKEAVIKAKAIDVLPKSAKTAAHELELAQYMNLVRENQLEFFETLIKPQITFALNRFSVSKQGNTFIDMDSHNELRDRVNEQTPPVIPADYEMERDEINELIAKIEDGRSSLYGGLYEIKSKQIVFDDVYSHCQSVYKALTMTNMEWDAKATFEIAVPREFTQARLMLNELVKDYEVKLEWFDKTYEAISRIVTVRMNEPGEMRRGDAASSLGAGKPKWQTGTKK